MTSCFVSHTWLLLLQVQEAGLKWRVALLEYSLPVFSSVSPAQMQALKPRIKKMLSALFLLPSKVCLLHSYQTWILCIWVIALPSCILFWYCAEPPALG